MTKKGSYLGSTGVLPFSSTHTPSRAPAPSRAPTYLQVNADLLKLGFQKVDADQGLFIIYGPNSGFILLTTASS